MIDIRYHIGLHHNFDEADVIDGNLEAAGFVAVRGSGYRVLHVPEAEALAVITNLFNCGVDFGVYMNGLAD